MTKETKADYMREYQRKNAASISERKKKDWQINKEHRQSIHKEWLTKNKKRVSAKHREYLQKNAKALRKKNALYYYTHKESCAQQSRLQQQEHCAFIKPFKALGCEICKSQKSPLAFHHVQEKAFALSSAAKKNRLHVLAEIKKCIILCATCHPKVHCGKIADADVMAAYIRFQIKIMPIIREKAEQIRQDGARKGRDVQKIRGGRKW